MLNKNLIKLVVFLLIGFVTIFIFSSVSAQSAVISKEPEKQEADLPKIPAHALYDSVWVDNKVSYGWRDSLKHIIIDSAFNVIMPLVKNNEKKYFHPFLGKVTSRFGLRRYRYHYGIDVNLNTGDTVVAAFDGMVRMSRYHYGYGNMVVLRHDNGLETVYAHFSRRLVDVNQVVKAGEPIGLGGNTGRSFGSHLHFEVRYLGLPFNPEAIIDFENGILLKDTLVLTAKHFDYIGTPGAPGTPAFAKYHTVRSGENLSVIAQKHRTTVNRICQLNNISRTTILQIGRTLRVR